MAKVKDIAMQIRGVSYHPEDLHNTLDEDSVVLLRANNIKDGKLILDDVVYVSKSKVAEQQYLQTGDILICASSGSKELVGKAAFVDSVKNPMTFGAFCKVVRPQPEYSEYLGHYFNSPVYRRKISALSAGANINNIKNEHIDNLDIQLVDEKERREIITILNELNMLISLRKQQLFKLDELVKARFVEMFGDPVANIANWPIERLEKHLTIIGGYAFKSDGFRAKGIPVLRIGNINSGYFQPTNMVYWHDDSTLERYKMHPGDLVISLTGTVGKNDYGNVCILGNDYSEYYLNQRNAKLELNETLNGIYLSELLKFPQIKGRLTGISRGIRQANISNKDILSLPILIPPISLQKQFAAFVERVERQKQTVQQSLEKLELMKKALMQEYFG